MHIHRTLDIYIYSPTYDMEKVIKGLTKATAADKEKKSKKRLQTFITEKNLTKKWKTLVKITGICSDTEA